MFIIKRFRSLLRPYYKDGLKISLSLLFLTLITVINPFFYKEIVDNGIMTGNTAYLIKMLVVLALARIIQELLYLLQTSITLKIRKGVFTKLRIDLYKHLLKLPQSFYSENHRGRMLSRITSDVDAVQNLLLDRFVYFVQNVLVGVFIFFIVIYINWKMIVAACVFLPIFYGLYLLFKNKIFMLSKIVQEKKEGLMERLQEDLLMVKAIQSFSVFEPRTEQTYIAMQATEDAKRKLSMKYAVASSSTTIINILGLLIIWGIGGIAVIKGEMTIGTLIAISFYLNYIVSLFFSAYDIVVGFHKSLPAAERIFEVMDLSLIIQDRPDAVDIDLIKASIEFENVSFSYPQREPVLKGVNFKLDQGDIVGIVGKSGQGKTTLANLIMRFYDPTEGMINIKGIDIKRIKLKSLRKSIAIVPQADYLFNASIKDNIVMGRKDVSEEQLRIACEFANVDSYIAKLEDGYDTIVGEDGIRLSAGQKKRISIARALLENPYVLILDEATTSLDRDSEEQILKSVKLLAKDRIVLIITHSIESIKLSNKVLYIDEAIVNQFYGYEEYIIEKHVKGCSKK